MPDDDLYLAFATEAEARGLCDRLDVVLRMPWRHPGRQDTLRWDEPYEDDAGRWIVTLERRILDVDDPRLPADMKDAVLTEIDDRELVPFAGPRPPRPESVEAKKL